MTEWTVLNDLCDITFVVTKLEDSEGRVRLAQKLPSIVCSVGKVSDVVAPSALHSSTSVAQGPYVIVALHQQISERKSVRFQEAVPAQERLLHHKVYNSIDTRRIDSMWPQGRWQLATLPGCRLKGHQYIVVKSLMKSHDSTMDTFPSTNRE